MLVNTAMDSCSTKIKNFFPKLVEISTRQLLIFFSLEHLNTDFPLQLYMNARCSFLNLVSSKIIFLEMQHISLLKSLLTGVLEHALIDSSTFLVYISNLMYYHLCS